MILQVKYTCNSDQIGVENGIEGKLLTGWFTKYYQFYLDSASALL